MTGKRHRITRLFMKTSLIIIVILFLGFVADMYRIFYCMQEVLCHIELGDSKAMTIHKLGRPEITGRYCGSFGEGERIVYLYPCVAESALCNISPVLSKSYNSSNSTKSPSLKTQILQNTSQIAISYDHDGYVIGITRKLFWNKDHQVVAGFTNSFPTLLTASNVTKGKDVPITATRD